MPDVVFNLSAEEGRFVSAMLNMLQLQKKSTDNFKDMKDQVEKFEKEYAKLAERESAIAAERKKKADEFEDQIRTSATLIGTGLVAAANAAGKALGEMYGQMVEKGKQANDQIRTIVGSLQDFGQIELLPEITKKLGEVRSSTLDQGQIKSLFAEISKAGGRDASPELRLAATIASARASDAGFTDVAGFGRTFVELGKLNSFKGFNNDQLANLTAKIQQEGGLGDDAFKNLQRAQAAGADLSTMQRVIELSIAAGRGGENGKTSSRILEEAFKEISPEDIATKFSKKDSPEAKARIATLEKERDGIEKRQRQIEDRELAMARERSDLDTLSKPRRKDAHERLEKEALTLREEKVQLSRRSEDISKEIAVERERKIEVAEPETAEKKRLKSLFLSNFGQRLQRFSRGEGLPEDLRLEAANIGSNLPEIDVNAAAGGGWNAAGDGRVAGALDTAEQRFENIRQRDASVALQRRTRRAQVERANRGQDVGAQAAAAVQAEYEAEREQEGLGSRFARNLPGAGTAAEVRDTWRNAEKAERTKEVYVKQARGVAGRDAEGSRNGGNE